MKVSDLNQVNNMIENNDSISESEQSVSKVTLFQSDIQDFPKKELHPVVFFLNIIWMLFCCHCNLYYVYGSGKQMQTKGKVGGVALGLTVLISLPTFFYFVSFKQLMRLTFLIDTIMVVTLAAAVAFLNLMFIFDDDDDWFWTVLEAGFITELVFYSTMTRVLLVHMKWSKWRIISIKISSMINSLMFFTSGVYYIYIDFTYTQHMLPSFDNKCHDFMLLFIFTMFSYTYELYAKVSDLDHTGDLRYIYALKNVDETLTKKKKSIIKRKRESINSISLLQKNEQTRKSAAGLYRLSRFAKIQLLQ